MSTEQFTPKTMARRDFIKQAGYGAAAGVVLSQVLPALGDDAAPTAVMALVGGAHIHTQGYIQILQGRKDVKVKCVWDHDAARAAKLAGVLGCPVVNDLKTIWSDAEIKSVVICSETDQHKDLVLAAAAAGKNMFVEKPLGFTSADSQAMAAAIEKAKVIFTTGYFMRTDPVLLFLKDQVRKGQLRQNFPGARFKLSQRFAGPLVLRNPDIRWMGRSEDRGSPAPSGIWGRMPWISLMWMFGDVESITADVKVVTGNYGDCDESGEGLMQFQKTASPERSPPVGLTWPIPSLSHHRHRRLRLH